MNRWIRIIGVLLIVILILFEQLLQLDSFMKQGYKLVLLVIVPLVVIYRFKRTTFTKEYHFNDLSWRDVKRPLYVGVVLYVLTIIGYIIFRPIIGTDTLVTGLEERGINADNIIFAGLYLSFINSFIEEFFFRGFLYQHFAMCSKTVGYFVSSALFSIYHVLVMFAIFDVLMGIVATLGLGLVGIGLVYINQSNKSIVNSWIVHIFADLAVISIGVFLVFGY